MGDLVARLKRLNRAGEEAYHWDGDAAMQWASEQRTWPTRRYRVEGSRAGNSRLVTFGTAVNLQKAYGGEIVELIEKRGTKEDTKRCDSRHLELGDCPVCFRPAGQPCERPSGERRAPHTARLGEFPSQIAAKGLPECPTCKAAAGAPCMRPRDQKWRRPHRARKKAAEEST